MMTLSNHFHGIVDYLHIIPFLNKPSVSKQKIPGGTGCTRLTLSSSLSSAAALTISDAEARDKISEPRKGASRPSSKAQSRDVSRPPSAIENNIDYFKEPVVKVRTVTRHMSSYICVTPSRLRSRLGWGPLSSWWWGLQTQLTGQCLWTLARPSKWPSVCGTQVRLQRQMHQSCVIICLLSRIKLSQTTISRKL